MNVIQRLEKAERSRLRKEDSYFKPMTDVKPYRKRTVWDHITRISVFIIFFIIGGIISWVGFSALIFYAGKIVANLK